MKFYFFKRNLTRQIILFCLLILLLLFTWQMVNDHSTIGIVAFGAAAILLLFWIVYQYCSYVRVDGNGVMYHAPLKGYCLRWNEIGLVKVMPRWNIQIPWIVVLRSDDPKDLTRKYNAMNRRDEGITFPYIKDAAELINRYRKESERERATFEPEAAQTQNEPEIKLVPEEKSIPNSIRITAIKKRYTSFFVCVMVLDILIAVWIGYGVLADNYLLIEKIFMWVFGIALIACAIVFFFQLLLGRIQYAYTVRISPEGVEYRKYRETYKMSWTEIDKILAMPDQRSAYNKNAFICFLRKGADPSVVTLQLKNYTPDFFGVQYRYRVVGVIRQYWSGQIWNIDRVCDKSKAFDC